ncbi:hypothetical protein Pmar_PMAR010461 [Perkinsus marinus ATCC 50983]|uniref:Uncharacterized protein n=1 Tax=Perkinsus marinus (strain ATCC 50983 / TXsc) TaxID=423536 RepID=C5LEC7_PERM5|nr:hypothetical protein Pmar_PMAR010461 [Perkinsus marinus ATCC 50983]EER04909.1 hypothetical protein Pmar_PMAR010461 [Perkinsus marinus ATCC 50983]|eukprot:XP_002773093.1 hypothetical protein Pmar_PMAR010461 [Perkinsus marinus ATCC 50983]
MPLRSYELIGRIANGGVERASASQVAELRKEKEKLDEARDRTGPRGYEQYAAEEVKAIMALP